MKYNLLFGGRDSLQFRVQLEVLRDNLDRDAAQRGELLLVEGLAGVVEARYRDLLRDLVHLVRVVGWLAPVLHG